MPTSAPSDFRELRRLLHSRHPCIAITTTEEPYALDVLRDAVGGDPRPFRTWSITRGLVDDPPLEHAADDDTMHPAAALYRLAWQTHVPQVAAMLDLGDHLDDARTRRLLREAIHAFESLGGTIVLVDSKDALPPSIASSAVRHDLSLPGEAELETIVRETVGRLRRDREIVVELRRHDLQDAVRNLRGLTRAQARRVITECVLDDARFDASDIHRIIVRKRRIFAAAGLLEFVETSEDLEAFGGMRRLKAWLRLRHRAFSPEAAQWGLTPPRGVLVLGVQGAGKSMCAKAVASAWRLPLLRMDPGLLFDRYVGESERRLREALQQVERMSPAVLWIDEIEKGFASAAAQSTDGGLAKRMFGTLLTWMQERESPAFLFATANDIEALPPELLRKGRFDEIFFVDLPSTEVRRRILEIHLGRRRQDPSMLALDRVAAATAGYTGAELEQGIVAALHEAMHRDHALDTATLERALLASPPLSVTMRERLERLRAWARGRCVMADEDGA